jgi:GntR family transcriptional regulator
LEFAVSWYPATIADAAPQLAVSEPLPGGSLAYIAETTGTRLRRANEQYVAESSNEEAAEALSIPSASAVLVVRTRLYDAEGNLIEYAETTLPAGVSRDRTFTITGN